MKCPVCENTRLQPCQLAPGLQAKQCPTCDGKWLASTHYWAWLDRQKTILPENEKTEDFEVNDTTKAKLCPECHRILMRYKVKADLGFKLDQCSSCNGVWFDRHEWEVLLDRNLHDELHRVFTEPWQQKIAQTESRAHRKSLLKHRLGETDYAELVRIATWLQHHPERHVVLAYLQNEDELL